jgi:hypothetical protein
MIFTRKSTIKLRADLAVLESTSFERLSIDELGELIEKIEIETQVLNRMRNLAGKAFMARVAAPPRPVALRAVRDRPMRSRRA